MTRGSQSLCRHERHDGEPELRTAEDTDLNSYGWVDRTAGIARIPIDRAMQLLLERGLPDVGAGQTRLSLMQARPSETASPPRLQNPE
jgi:hypothetical protein